MIHGTDTLHGWQICDSLRSYSADTDDDDTSTVTVYVAYTDGASTDSDIARCRREFSTAAAAAAVDALNELADTIQDEKSDDEPEELERDFSAIFVFSVEKQKTPKTPKIRPKARSPPDFSAGFPAAC